MSSLSRLGAVMRKETLQMRRDRLTFAMIIGIPLLQILLFGYAINTDVRNITTAVADEANTHLSREFIAQLGETQVTRIDQRVNTAAELEALLRTGKISIGVAIPADFDRRVVDHERFLSARHADVDLGEQHGIEQRDVQAAAGVVDLEKLAQRIERVRLAGEHLARNRPLRRAGSVG